MKYKHCSHLCDPSLSDIMKLKLLREITLGDIPRYATIMHYRNLIPIRFISSVSIFKQRWNLSIKIYVTNQLIHKKYFYLQFAYAVRWNIGSYLQKISYEFPNLFRCSERNYDESKFHNRGRFAKISQTILKKSKYFIFLCTGIISLKYIYIYIYIISDLNMYFWSIL